MKPVTRPLEKDTMDAQNMNYFGNDIICTLRDDWSKPSDKSCWNFLQYFLVTILITSYVQKYFQVLQYIKKKKISICLNFFI